MALVDSAGRRVRPASLRWRSAAFVLDSYLAFAVGILVLVAAHAKLGWPAEFTVLGPLFHPVYFLVFEVLMGTTPFKWLFGLKLIMEDGFRISKSAALTRNLHRIPDSFGWGIPEGLAEALADDLNRRYGDVVAGTILVRRTRYFGK